jgi:hypothetical protein
MKGLMMRCENWGNGHCHPDIKRYNSGSGFNAKPVEPPGPQLMEIYDRICRACQYRVRS